MTELHRILVHNLKRLRGMQKLSQAELAEKAELSSGYVGEIEMGRKFPAPEALERLATALGTRPYRLLMGEDDVAEWGGDEAFYAAADSIRASLMGDLDRLVRARAKDEGKAPD